MQINDLGLRRSADNKEEGNKECGQKDNKLPSP